MLQFLIFQSMNSSSTLIKHKTVYLVTQTNTEYTLTCIRNKNQVIKPKIPKTQLKSLFQCLMYSLQCCHSQMNFHDRSSEQRWQLQSSPCWPHKLSHKNRKPFHLPVESEMWPSPVGAELYGVDQSKVRHINLSWHTSFLNRVHLKGWDAIQTSAGVMKLDWHQRVEVSVRISTIARVWRTSLRKKDRNHNLFRFLRFVFDLLNKLCQRNLLILVNIIPETFYYFLYLWNNFSFLDDII